MPVRPEVWPVPTPLPVGPMNAYRIEGPAPCLVDAGPRTDEASDYLGSRLRAKPVRVVVLTHAHADHAGLAKALQRDLGVEVWAHRKEAAALEHHSERALEREEDYARGLRAAGVPPLLQEHMRYGGRKYDAWTESVRPDRVFEGDDEIQLAGLSWRVVDAPGHTPGGFLLTQEGVTFSGDTLLERITPNALSVRESERGALVDYLRSLERLRGQSWGLVHPGHGRPFSDATPIIERALHHAAVRRERIHRSLGAGPRTAFEVLTDVFPRLPDHQAFLAVSEVLGHLEAMRQDGHVGVQRLKGVDVFHAAAGTY